MDDGLRVLLVDDHPLLHAGIAARVARLGKAPGARGDLFPVDTLSEREQEVLSLMARGWDNAHIWPTSRG